MTDTQHMDQITTIEETRRRARAAYHRGHTLHEHGPNWHSAAYPVWKDEFEQLEKAARLSAQHQEQAT